MNHRKVIAGFIALSMLSVIACASREAISLKSTGPEPIQIKETVQGTTKEAWEVEWDKLLAEAKREGRVMFYTTAGLEAQEALRERFAARFGLKLDFVSARGAELGQKLLTEARAGLHLADIYAGGPTTILLGFKPSGILGENLHETFLLPEVKDLKFWYKGEQMWADRERTAFRFLAYGSGKIAINTNLVKPDEIKKVEDLLNPKWKGKIIINDPTIQGVGSSVVNVAAFKYGWDLWRQLVRQQEPLILRDYRLMISWLSLGKYAIVTGPHPEAINEAMKAGAPIDSISVIGMDYISGHLISLLKNAPHPRAAKVFINWVLSREGQEIYSKGTGRQSAREDLK